MFHLSLAAFVSNIARKQPNEVLRWLIITFFVSFEPLHLFLIISYVAWRVNKLWLFLFIVPTWLAFLGYSFVVYKIGPQDFGFTLNGVLIDKRWERRIPKLYPYYSEIAVRHPKHFDYFKQFTLCDRTLVLKPPKQSALKIWVSGMGHNQAVLLEEPYLHYFTNFYYEYIKDPTARNGVCDKWEGYNWRQVFDQVTSSVVWRPQMLELLIPVSTEPPIFRGNIAERKTPIRWWEHGTPHLYAGLYEVVDLQAPRPRAWDEPGVREVLRHRTSPHPLVTVVHPAVPITPAYPGLYGITVGSESHIPGIRGIIAPYWPEDWQTTK